MVKMIHFMFVYFTTIFYKRQGVDNPLLTKKELFVVSVNTAVNFQWKKYVINKRTSVNMR